MNNSSLMYVGALVFGSCATTAEAPSAPNASQGGKADSFEAFDRLTEVSFSSELMATAAEVSSDVEVRGLIDKQLLYTVAQHRSSGLDLRNATVTDINVEVADGGVSKVSYHVVVPGIRFGYRALPDNYALPRDVSASGLDAFATKYRAIPGCRWGMASRNVDATNFWFSYTGAEGCKDSSDTITVTTAVTAVGRGPRISDRYLELDSMLEDGSIEYVVVFGSADSTEFDRFVSLQPYASNDVLERNPSNPSNDVSFKSSRVHVTALRVGDMAALTASESERFAELSSKAEILAYYQQSFAEPQLRALMSSGNYSFDKKMLLIAATNQSAALVHAISLETLFSEAGGDATQLDMITVHSPVGSADNLVEFIRFLWGAAAIRDGSVHHTLGTLERLGDGVTYVGDDNNPTTRPVLLAPEPPSWF